MTPAPTINHMNVGLKKKKKNFFFITWTNVDLDGAFRS